MKKILFTLLAILILIAGYFVFMKKSISEVSNIPASWLTYIGNGVQFQYPKSFGANVWSAVIWPPKVTLVPVNEDPVALGCPMLNDNGNSSIKTEGKTKNGVSYVLYTGGGAGAGSLYSSYCYVIEGKNTYSVLYFEIRSHTGCEQGNCGAYCGTQFENECRSFDLTRDVTMPIETIVSTIKTIQ